MDQKSIEEKEEIESNLINENIIKEKENNNIEEVSENLLKYNDLKPINLIECIEKKYNLFLPSSQNKLSMNQLELYKSTSNIKYKILDFKNKQSISERLLNKNSSKCFQIKGNNLFGADDQGIVHLLQLDKEYEITKFYLENIKNIQVTSIDISNNSDYLLIGYSNGYIALFSINNQKLIHLMKEYCKTKIVAIKFLNVSKKYYEFIYSSLSGHVNKVSVSEGIFKTSSNEENIFKDKTTTFALELFKPINEYDLNLLAIANFDEIRIYIIKPKKTYLIDTKVINKKNNDEELIIDISFGIGYSPLNYKNSIFHNNETENRKENLLLIASYGNIIKLYSYDIKKDKDDNIQISVDSDGKEIGYFINNNNIIRIGFISNSIFYLFDLDDFNCLIKVINTAYMKYGEYEENNNISYEDNQKALIEKGLKIDNTLNRTTFNNINDKKCFYRNFIFHSENTIFFFAKKRFYIGNLLNFAESFADLEKNKQWMEALCLGIDLYQEKMTLLPQVPFQSKKRKQILLPLLKELLNRYIDFTFKENNSNNISNNSSSIHISNSNNSLNIINESDDDLEIKINENEEKIKNCMNISIEFCIGINQILFLLMDVSATFSSKGKSDDFIKSIEPFIFSGQLNSENIFPAIPNLYAPYKTMNQLGTFSHLLINLDFESINQDMIKLICLSDNLFITLIYLFSNGNDYREFFLPIVKMYNYYTKKSNEKNDNFISYMELYQKLGLNDMQFSKEYVFHKLMWYIDLSLNKKNFSFLKILKNHFKLLIVKIIIIKNSFC